MIIIHYSLITKVLNMKYWNDSKVYFSVFITDNIFWSFYIFNKLKIKWLIKRGLNSQNNNAVNSFPCIFDNFESFNAQKIHYCMNSGQWLSTGWYELSMCMLAIKIYLVVLWWWHWSLWLESNFGEKT